LIRFGGWVLGIGEELQYSSKDVGIVEIAAAVTGKS